ncbi:MAG: hypothetical protein AAF696_36195 [Bacteroidota bacterium]
MKKISVLFCILFTALSMHAQQSIAGIWNTGKENTKIEITEVNGLYQGKIISSDNSAAKIGTILLKDIKPLRKGYKGKLFAAKKGEWMDAVLKEKDNQLSITVSVGFMSKTIEWAKE